MVRLNFSFWFILLFSLIIASSSCKKDDLLTESSAKLEFSEDTIMFDTVFASLGSTTKQLKLFNRNSQPIRVSSIRLAGGNASTYRLNVDGLAGKSFTDVEIPAKDSLFIFVEVTIDPLNVTTPYIVQDSIIFETNGNIQDVDLVAFGQFAHFIIADNVLGVSGAFIKYALLDTALNANMTLYSDTPYVVWGGYLVVDSSQQLTIQPGTKIYFGTGSGIWVYRYGTIKVEGTQTNPVLFQGIRRESYYQDIPGQWDRIWINEGSVDNVIDYAEIRNAFIGIQTESLFDTLPPKNLKLTNTIIYNASGFGIFSRYFNIQAKNTVITRCGQYAVALTQGGGYEFRHCTIANYWNNGQRSTPSVYMNDFAVDENDNLLHFPLYKADFFNSIIWGNNDEELEIDYEFSSDIHNFQNVLLKTELDINTPNFTNIILNQDPLFVDYGEDDYQLQSSSPAVNAGDPSLVDGDTGNDIKGIGRAGSPDLGAYEFQ